MKISSPHSEGDELLRGFTDGRELQCLEISRFLRMNALWRGLE